MLWSVPLIILTEPCQVNCQMLGARVFEKHVTFNRAEKGTDHTFLEPDGFRKFVRDINRTDLMLRQNPSDLGWPVFVNLQITVARVDIKAGELFSTENLSGRFLTKHYTCEAE